MGDLAGSGPAGKMSLTRTVAVVERGGAQAFGVADSCLSPPPSLHPVTSLIKSCREACSIHRDSGWGCLLRRLFWGALHWMWILGCLLHGRSKFISSMLDWIYGSLRCFFCFFALPLLLVVLWLVSNKVEKVQKESTIGLFKIQHVL